ncbi:MAG TPA: hypothetical protein VFN09_09315 [Rhodanobacteraceae bacterium]|nr:hypothetical protein [Rhodanobacteraceae bacterium]
MDYLAYYDLEHYLFDRVAPAFHRCGTLGAFDFFSIVVWKANRSRSVTARRLLRLGHARGLGDLDHICRTIGKALATAATDPQRLDVLLRDWGFRLPMASAILTVLYPDRFTVYDYRLCEQLEQLGQGTFKMLADKADLAAIQHGYQTFIKAVRCVQASLRIETLRDTDRYLIARSMANDLTQAIQHRFSRPAATTGSNPPTLGLPC